MEVNTVRENGRWRLTDLQSFLIVFTVIAALFIAAMALGGSNPMLFLLAGGLVAAAALSVIVAGLRRGGRQSMQGTGYVIAVQRPPTDNIQGRCDMRMRVNLPGRPAVDMKVRDPAVPVTRWPVVGQTLPIEVAPNNPKHIRVRWDLVELGYVRVPDATPPRGAPAPSAPPAPTATLIAPLTREPELEYSPTPGYVPLPADDQLEYSPTPGYVPLAPDDELEYSPTPGYVAPRSDAELVSSPTPPRMEPDESDPTVPFAIDPIESPVVDPMVVPPLDEPPLAQSPLAEPPPEIFTSFRLDAFDDPFDFEADPTIRDDYARDAHDEPPKSTSERAEAASIVEDFIVDDFIVDDFIVEDFVDESPTAPAIPTPRPGDEPAIQFTGGPRPDGEIPTMGGMLIVSDLDRSLRFYADVLGFTVVYAASGNAVVEYGNARLLLQHMADFSPIERRVGHLHIEVPDLDVAFTELTAKGVEFSHQPRMVSRGDDTELWKATFRDPDGHGIALTEWRRR